MSEQDVSKETVAIRKAEDAFGCPVPFHTAKSCH